jgi:hypothetical protein
MLLFVVTKNTLVLLRIAIGVPGAVHLPYRSGSRPFYRKMAAGAKAQFSFRLFYGPTKVVP